MLPTRPRPDGSSPSSSRAGDRRADYTVSYGAQRRLRLSVYWPTTGSSPVTVSPAVGAAARSGRLRTRRHLPGEHLGRVASPTSTISSPGRRLRCASSIGSLPPASSSVRRRAGVPRRSPGPPPRRRRSRRDGHGRAEVPGTVSYDATTGGCASSRHPPGRRGRPTPSRRRPPTSRECRSKKARPGRSRRRAPTCRSDSARAACSASRIAHDRLRHRPGARYARREVLITEPGNITALKFYKGAANWAPTPAPCGMPRATRWRA